MGFKVGDKFIIEIAERVIHTTDEGHGYDVFRIKGFNSLMFDDYGLKRLTKLQDQLDKQVFDDKCGWEGK